MSEATMTKLFARLGASSCGELLGRNYQGLSRDHDVDRVAHMRLYADRNRGSVRINSGRFYTIAEYEDRVARVKERALP